MTFLGRILTVIGLGAVLMGGFKTSLLLRGSTLPETIPIAELGHASGTSNVHLTVTDFRFGEHIVTLKNDGTWGRAWIPLLTPEGRWTTRPVVLHSKFIKNKAQLQAVLRRDTVTGVASNFMQSLGSSQQGEFAKIYPNDNLSGAIALELDAAMPSPWVAFPLFLFGLLTLPAGLRLLYRAYFAPETQPCPDGG